MPTFEGYITPECPDTKRSALSYFNWTFDLIMQLLFSGG